MIFQKILSKINIGNTLFYPGCLSKFAAGGLVENYKKVLDFLKIDYIIIPNEELCCGSPALNAGYKDDFFDLIKKNKTIFKKYGITKIITNCPSCNHIFRKYYDLNSEHITQTIFRKLNKLNFEEKNKKITYHDPCHLGRKEKIYDEPRKILEILGYEVVELINNKENSMCCGGGAGLKSNFPDLSNKIAKKLLKKVTTTKLVTTCPLCFKNFEENNHVKIYELSELILENVEKFN